MFDDEYVTNLSIFYFENSRFYFFLTLKIIK